MADDEEMENRSTSSDDDDDDDEDDDEESSSSSSDTTTDEDEADQAEDESDDDLASSGNKLAPKEAHLLLENKRKQLSKRLLELRDELKAQPQTDIEVKKRLLIEIKNLREKWIRLQTRLTNMKARLSHSPTPERRVAPAQPAAPAARARSSSYSSTSRSRSSSPGSDSGRSSAEKPYHDLDALDERRMNEVENRGVTARVTTSYRDLTEDFSLAASPSPPASPLNGLTSISLSNLDRLSLVGPSKNDDEENDEDQPVAVKETFTNQKIPYPVVNDKRDLELINRQLKNQLRQFEASRNNPLFGLPDNLMIYERLKKQNEFINIRMKIERLKKFQPKTQREREQNKKQFHLLLQEFRKLQRFMRSANRDTLNNSSFIPIESDSFASSIPMPPSPEAPRPIREELQLPPLDLHRVTGKKILFESSDSEDESEQTTAEPHVPVAESISEPRTVPEEFPPIPSSLPLPMPSNSSSSATLDAIKNRVANLINPPAATPVKPEEGEEDEDEDDDENQPVAPTLLSQTAPLSAKFNRKRRRTKKHKNKKKQNQQPVTQTTTNEDDPSTISHEEAWRRHVAMQLQMKFLKQSNPVLKALTAEAQKKLGITQDEVDDFTFDDDDMMDYETALILQQQQEFLAAAAANPFHILHNAAAGSSSSRPNLVDVLSNLNGGIPPSSSGPQTPMGLLQKFFLDANANADNRSHMGGNDLSGTPPTPPSPRDISIGKKIVESLTHHDINALLKLSGSEHDDDDEDDEENPNDRNRPYGTGDTDDELNPLYFDDDDDDDDQNDEDLLNGNNRQFERWDRPTPNAPLRSTSNSMATTNKKSAVDTLILPSFNRCTHLGKSNKRSAGLERMFPSFSKHNAGPSSTLSLILYGLSSTP